MLIFCHVCFRFLSFERLSSNSASPAPEVTAFVKLQCALLVMVRDLDFEAAEPPQASRSGRDLSEVLTEFPGKSP